MPIKRKLTDEQKAWLHQRLIGIEREHDDSTITIDEYWLHRAIAYAHHPDRDKLVVLICGLPSSGNNVIRAHLYRAGADEVHVTHMDTPHLFEKIVTRRRPTWRKAIVIPTRSDPSWTRSVERKWSGWGYHKHTIESYRAAHWSGVEAVLAKYPDIPVHRMRYEDLVVDPVGVGDDLTDFCGLPRAPWPERVNESEPWNGAVFDANAKYETAEVANA